jgi:manganese/zinc/iron transport system substrate-binding protein
MPQKMFFDPPHSCRTGRLKRLHVLMLAVMPLLAAGCGRSDTGAGGGPPAGESQRSRPTVVATTTIVADLVRQVAGDRVECVSLMGAGIDPHSYRPTPRDADRLAKADLVVASGLHLEGKLAELLGRIAHRTPVVFVAEAVPEEARLEAAAGIADPHIWFDLALWAGCVTSVVEPLSSIDPDAAEAFQQAAEAYRQSLLSAHEAIHARMASIEPRRRVLVTAHDAFRYCGRAYDIEVVGVQGVSTETEAGLADINRLVELLVSRQIPAVFVETSVSDRSVQAIREGAEVRGHAVATGGRLYSDALGEPGSGAETLLGAIESNVDVIVAALGGGESTRGDAPLEQAAP